MAQRLLAYEAGSRDAAHVAPTAGPVSEKLRRHLGKLLGPTGYQALLTRALTLARRDAPGLSTVQVNADGSLEGLAELSERAAPEAHAMLITHLLALLITFIGESLTLHLLRDVWADFPAGASSDEAK